MKYAAAPLVSASTWSSASPSGWPVGRRPSVSTVNDSETGTRSSAAARTTPIPSSTEGMVSAETSSTPARASTRSWARCRSAYQSAVSAADEYASPCGPSCAPSTICSPASSSTNATARRFASANPASE
jgi:hypothetical protein